MYKNYTVLNQNFNLNKKTLLFMCEIKSLVRKFSNKIEKVSGTGLDKKSMSVTAVGTLGSVDKLPEDRFTIGRNVQEPINSHSQSEWFRALLKEGLNSFVKITFTRNGKGQLVIFLQAYVIKDRTELTITSDIAASIYSLQDEDIEHLREDLRFIQADKEFVGSVKNWIQILDAHKDQELDRDTMEKLCLETNRKVLEAPQEKLEPATAGSPS